MGWLFGRKKPKVPFPEGRPFEEGALRVPGRLSRRRVIEPEQVKAAAGLERPLPPLPRDEEEYAGERSAFPVPPMQPGGRMEERAGPLFVKVDVYQRILTEIDNIRSNANQLAEINKVLETSEYNEEANFTKLRRAVKNMHDRLLQIDNTLFKS